MELVRGRRQGKSGVDLYESDEEDITAGRECVRVLGFLRGDNRRREGKGDIKKLKVVCFGIYNI